mgnify:CR=1 FL=1
MYDFDGCIQIDTDGDKHIDLTKEHIFFLLEFINYSERLNLESLRTTEEEVESLKNKDGI